MNYNFHINDFSGPLDLLLHLVKEKKKDIYEINVCEIIIEYIDFINKMEELNIDVASEYLVMASELIHLKSKILLNIEDETEEEFEINNEEDLKNRLALYETYKNLSKDFKSLEEKRSYFHTKSPESYKEYIDDVEVKYESEYDANDLFNALLNYLDRLNKEKPIQTKIAKKEISVEDRTLSIRNILKEKRKVDFYDLFDIYNKEYIVVTFLSILEMSKNKEIIINQDNNFDNILIEAR